MQSIGHRPFFVKNYTPTTVKTIKKYTDETSMIK